MEVVVTNGAIKTCKVPPQQWNTQLFTGQMPFFSPSQQCQGTERKKAQDCIFSIWYGNLYCQRIEQRQVFGQSVEGFLLYRGSTFPLSHRKMRSVLSRVRLRADLVRVKMFDATSNIEWEAEKTLEVVNGQRRASTEPVFQRLITQLHYHYRPCYTHKQKGR